MIEFNHDYSGYHKPNCCKSWRGGQKFFHDLELNLNNFSELLGSLNQRGETVTLLSTSVSLFDVSSAKAAKGHLAESRVHLRATGRSI